ncbi:hypothetical protein J2X20_005825 [Pelomonas saccharophila]|uniref:SMEK domain-containing protein n=1 Tax=Roseateles saccharophilus TaxID=304 RepID=A0ABU1YY08_ROSSA|nr:SMEK domain-containing protein [Roseateles saccharophilus]MDR7273140.1 hypothetical protein [Roseateles saccharophilus]
MIEAQLNNLNQDIAILQRYISLGKDIGFNNMARLLEALTIAVFKAAGIANLQSKSQIKVNFPAIDAADNSGGGIAVQVTSNADAAKVKKTILAFEKRDAKGASLKDQYAKLYIFGFCNHAKRAKAPAYCEVIGTQFLIDQLTTLNDEARIQAVADAIHQHVSYASIHPYTDVDCLKIALGFIGRNALRHKMSCEGNVDDMTRGLNEISELINKGTVNGRTRSKARDQFLDDNIKAFLGRVSDTIGQITAIVYSKPRFSNNWINLTPRDDAAIDALKESISADAMFVAKKYGIAHPLAMISA